MNQDIKLLDGIIIKSISGFCYVESDNKIYECKPRGAFRKTNISPVAGDLVSISVNGDKGVVEEIKDRKNFLLRPPLANIDKLFIVSSCSVPSVNTLLIDRMTIIAEYLNIVPVIVFNKSDLGDFGDLPNLYKRIGYNTFVVSATENIGMDALKNEINGCVSAFSGNSGVGKSSILNRIIPDLKLSTGDVSQKLGRGKHTTRNVELFKCNGGYVADTPGFSSLSLYDFQIDDKQQLQFYFKEFNEIIGGCRFTSCTHTTELGCKVIDAIKDGLISKSRHESYLSMYKDLKDIKSWEIRR